MKNANHCPLILLVTALILLLPFCVEAKEGADGIFGDFDTEKKVSPVPLLPLNYVRVDQVPQTYDTEFFTVTWVGDGEVDITVKKGFSIGFHLSSYVYPPGTWVRSNGEPWEVQTLLDDSNRLFKKGAESATLKVKLPPEGEPAQIDLYTYRFIGKQWVADVVKVPPHHGPTFGEDRKLHSARIINFTRGPDYSAVPGLETGSLNPSDFGYGEIYRPIYDLVEKFVQVNRDYQVAAGHSHNDGFAGITDCSGFIGQMFQKLSALSGVPKGFDGYPPSGGYRTIGQLVSNEYPPTDPRDLVKPGDVLVHGDDAGTGGHITMFMGYDAAGNPLIAHSTSSTSQTRVLGQPGARGVRLEVMPPGYRSKPRRGIFRLPNLDEMLRKISGA